MRPDKAIKAVELIIDILWKDAGKLNPDKEWDSDTAGDIADILHVLELSPRETRR